ncbi:MAG TPA: 4-hydroxy-tetrahydrodipicolinate reductase [Candidatus Avacidaminococcus intestinavium]|uniref:4-hydroxy-tetrahydrodipicolinate reductase n=1 Tax=Candidatus Avacidaminococcus intestinavium TaxID=2840684 RepID=A0A9D1MPT9_9FIRM|nr:4-hydroxy-tetrahydrodipicolinate reductase [Candidatus Avacidaminococcus intestinavium]
MLRVLVNGALGRMGCEVVKTVLNAEDMELVGAVDCTPELCHIAGKQITVTDNLASALEKTKPDIVVDFTRPNVVMANLRIILQHKVNAVVGTTGFTPEDLAELDLLAQENQTGILIAPNFALGAILMMKMACEAAKYFPQVEIIELHHDQKLDAPSGTAVLTAQKLAEVRGSNIQQGHPNEVERLAGARGANFEGMRIHSVRLPGFVASQEIIFGSSGETLKIRNDSINRECYMPGVMLGCHKIIGVKGLIYGLDKLLD